MYVLINVQVVNVCTCNTNTELGFCGQCLSLLNVKQIWQASITWQITLGRKLNLLLGICLLNDFFVCLFPPPPSYPTRERVCSNVIKWGSPAYTKFQHSLSISVWGLFYISLYVCRNFRHLLISSLPSQYSLFKIFH